MFLYVFEYIFFCFYNDIIIGFSTIVHVLYSV